MFLKLHFFSILFFFIISSSCFANKQIDSLENELKNSSGIKKVKLFNELSQSLLNKSIEKSLKYGESALILAKKINNKKEEAKAYNNLGLIYVNKSKFDKAINYFKLSLSINKELNETNRIIETLSYIGELYYYRNDYKTAQDYFQKALIIFNSNSNSDSLLLASLYDNLGSLNKEWAEYDKALEYYEKSILINKAKNNKLGTAYCYNSIGKVYYSLGSYSKSLDYYQKSLNLCEELKQDFLIAVLYNNIGQIYYQLKNYEKSLEFYEKSIKIKEKFHNKRGIAISLRNIGNIYYYLKEYDKALIYYQEALSIENTLKNKKGIADNYNNIGLIYIEKKHYNEAIDYFNKSIKLKEEIGDLSGIANAYDNLGLLYKEKGDYRKAIKSYHKSQKIALKIKTKKNILNNYEGLYISYYKLGDYQKAFKYSKLYIDLYDTVFNNESQKKITIFQNKLEIEKKEKELQLLSKDKELQQEKINRQRTASYFFIVGIILIIVLLFLIYNRYLLKVKINKKLESEIDERRNVEKELRKAKEFIELIIKNAEEGILIIDTNGLILECNNAFLKFFDYERKDIINKDYRELKTGYLNDFNNDFIQKLLQEKVYKHIEKEYTRKDGSIHQYRISFSFIKNGNGEASGIISIISDITKETETRKELEKYKIHLEQLIIDRTKELVIAKERAEESDKLKTSFLANLSHEIRTPMNAIIGFSDLLADPDLTTDQREEYIQLISTSGNELVHLIDDIIDLSKIETNQIRISKTETKINDLLNKIHSYYLNLLGKDNSNISLKLNIDEDNDYIINTDKFRLKEILSKLVDNSIKFTEKGEVEIGYSIENESIRFYVKDTGIGIPKEKQNLVFKKFWKDEAMIKLRRGTGLGLSIAEKFVELLNGKIWFDSDEKGTIFYVTIPAEDIIIDKQKKNNRIKFDDYNWKNKTILIAEDEQTNFQYLNEVLKITNATVLWAKNGQEAVDICNRSKNINIVLMDLKMPVLNGYEATSIIKKNNTEIPVIAQTAYAMSDDKKKIEAVGCDEYLIKPIKVKKLLTTIQKFI